MAQHHLDALSAVDASFLHQERGATHMHIGGILLLDGPPPGFPSFREHVRSRLALVPRYRQKLVAPPLGLGRPRWVDDPTFNIDYHVRHTALPAPGGRAELWRSIGRVFSQRLDRTKPLWELWMVEGLEGGGWALGAKTHHALVDGISGVDLLSVLFDLEPDPAAAPPPDPWLPRPEPTTAELAVAGLRGAASAALAAPLRAGSVLLRPRRALEDAQALGEVAMAAISPAPSTPMNVPIGPHRRFAVVRADLDDFKAVKNAFGGTVNDVVLAVVAGGLARWLHARGLRTEGLRPRACVPVSIRSRGEQGALGNRLTQMVVALPVGVQDPVTRLTEVREAMAGVKESKQALGAEVIASLEDFAPPTILAQASRLNFSSRLYNLLVTNIPGPQVPLYVLGRRAREAYPIPFLAGERALAVAIMSYDGTVGFGLLADLDALPDVQAVADGIEASLAELVERARGGAPAGLGLRTRPRRRPAKRGARTATAARADPRRNGPPG